MKSISFIDITTITYNEVSDCSTNLVRAPLHQDPSAPPHIFLLSHFFSRNGMGSYGGKRGKWGILTTRLQMLEARRGCEMGRV
jgi:hypothetical protein